MVRLTPTGELRWGPIAPGTLSPALSALEAVFRADWRSGLFALAAEKTDPAGSVALRYWRELAERYLQGLCHLPREATTIEVAPPGPGELATLLLIAPPMEGGEYLAPEVLLHIWDSLQAFVRTAAVEVGGVGPLLDARAPAWSQVGRVCFHLADNKGNADRPFAFMATYAAGFGASGKLRHLPLGRALEQYAGARNRAALIHLLSPVREAGDRLEWVRELTESGRLYRPAAWTPEAAYALLLAVPILEQSGLAVRLPNWWKKRPRPRVSVTIGEQTRSLLGADALLDFNVEIALGDVALSDQELATLMQGEGGLVLFKGQWIEVDRGKLEEAIAHFARLQSEAVDGQVSFVQGMRLLAGASDDLEHEEQAEDEQPWVHVQAGDALRRTLEALRDPAAIEAEADDDGLRADLRHYQTQGVAWLRLLTGLGLGACLADDMGLGKTMQVLALLLRERRQPGRASLLVVPASLLGNWGAEAERFAPSLRLMVVHPSETDKATRTAIAAAPDEHLAGTDLVVTTYGMVTRQGWFAEVEWRLIILDEAQAIKNPGTRQTRAVKKLKARARIALTGTPVENRLGDLWSLFDFLNPGLLGSATVFGRFIKGLQARERDRFAPLRRLVGPYILRRLKTDRTVIADLPDKTEITRYCSLTRAQADLYRRTVEGLKEALASSEGIARRGLVLQSITRLKQVCNHPSQLTGDGAYVAAESGKFHRLTELCDEVAARQEKVLVFTQFREVIDPIADHLKGIFGCSGLVLHGGTSVGKRKTLVQQFQDPDGPPFFVLSLKAGGTGLNLTAASHVIHFDRWWNPAVESQATDRAYRIGQKRNVLVHKFVTRGTVEERIDAMIDEKRALTEGVLAGDDQVQLTELGDEALLDLVRLDVTRAAL